MDKTIKKTTIVGVNNNEIKVVNYPRTVKLEKTK